MIYQRGDSLDQFFELRRVNSVIRISALPLGHFIALNVLGRSRWLNKYYSKYFHFEGLTIFILIERWRYITEVGNDLVQERWRPLQGEIAAEESKNALLECRVESMMCGGAPRVRGSVKLSPRLWVLDRGFGERCIDHLVFHLAWYSSRFVPPGIQERQVRIQPESDKNASVEIIILQESIILVNPFAAFVLTLNQIFPEEHNCVNPKLGT
jgi:hypothetical protein